MNDVTQAPFNYLIKILASGTDTNRETYFKIIASCTFSTAEVLLIVQSQGHSHLEKLLREISKSQKPAPNVLQLTNLNQDSEKNSAAHELIQEFKALPIQEQADSKKCLHYAGKLSLFTTLPIHQNPIQSLHNEAINFLDLCKTFVGTQLELLLQDSWEHSLTEKNIVCGWKNELTVLSSTPSKFYNDYKTLSSHLSNQQKKELPIVLTHYLNKKLDKLTTHKQLNFLKEVYANVNLPCWIGMKFTFAFWQKPDLPDGIKEIQTILNKLNHDKENEAKKINLSNSEIKVMFTIKY